MRLWVWLLGVYVLFCLAVVVGSLPGGFLETTPPGGKAGTLTAWIPLGSWVDVGGVRFKVVYETTEFERYFALLEGNAIVSKARLELGERTLVSPDLTLVIRDYYFIGQPMTAGGMVLCDITATRPRLSLTRPVYSRSLASLRALALETVRETRQIGLTDISVHGAVVYPHIYFAPVVSVVDVRGRLIGPENFVTFEFRIDWFAGVSERQLSSKMRSLRYETRQVTARSGEWLSVAFTLNGMVTPRARLWVRTVAPSVSDERDLGYVFFDGISAPAEVEFWKPIVENWFGQVTSQVQEVSDRVTASLQSLQEMLRQRFEAYNRSVEQLGRDITALEEYVRGLAENVGEAFRRHENWTLTQLEKMRDWTLASFAGMTKPSVVVNAPQEAVAGIPNFIQVQPVNAVIQNVEVSDGTGTLLSLPRTWFSVTPRIPGSGLKLRVTYMGTMGEWAGRTFTEEFDIPILNWSGYSVVSNEPLHSPPPEGYSALDLMLIGGVFVAASAAVLLLVRRRRHAA